jgi:hypothetical protein
MKCEICGGYINQRPHRLGQAALCSPKCKRERKTQLQREQRLRHKDLERMPRSGAWGAALK